MKKLSLAFGIVLVLNACKKDTTTETPEEQPVETLPSATVQPVDINQKGFDFLENMQGHWVGFNQVVGTDYDWFCFDYRPISPSHIHGIFEGGTTGNLFTSFFVTDFKETRTIMARNGGLLNGIYRTSYFVLDSVLTANNESYYRFVDAKGGEEIMSMHLRFTGDSLYFNAYTSRLGLVALPNRHMTFKAKREQPELAEQAASSVGFPQNVIAHDFSTGFREDYLYKNTGEDSARSATFMSQGNGSVFQLAVESGDPYTISDHPYLSTLKVNLTRSGQTEGKNVFLYLSTESLTDQNGYFLEEPFNTVTIFPEIVGTQNSFTYTYLHPGNYFITAIADVNEDGYISAGDVTNVSKAISITPEGNIEIDISDINVQN